MHCACSSLFDALVRTPRMSRAVARGTVVDQPEDSKAMGERAGGHTDCSVSRVLRERGGPIANGSECSITAMQLLSVIEHK